MNGCLKNNIGEYCLGETISYKYDKDGDFFYFLKMEIDEILGSGGNILFLHENCKWAGFEKKYRKKGGIFFLNSKKKGDIKRVYNFFQGIGKKINFIFSERVFDVFTNGVAYGFLNGDVVCDYQLRIGKDKVKIERYKGKWTEFSVGHDGFLKKKGGLPPFSSACFIGRGGYLRELLETLAKMEIENGNRVLYVRGGKKEIKNGLCVIGEGDMGKYNSFDFNVIIFEGYHNDFETNFKTFFDQKRTKLIWGVSSGDEKPEICNIGQGASNIAFVDYVFSFCPKKSLMKMVFRKKYGFEINVLRGESKNKIKI